MPESSNIQVISGAGVLLGLGSLLTGNPLIMYAGGCFLGGSIASFTLAGRFEDKLKAELEEANTEHLNAIEALQIKVSQLEKSIKDKGDYLEKLTTANQILRQEKLEACVVRDSKNEELAQTRKQLNDLQIELAQYEQGVKESLEVVPLEALKIVRRTYDKAMKEMKCLTTALSRNYPDCEELLQGFEAEILSLGERYLKEIIELETVPDYQSLLDKGTAITERIIESGAKLRLRAQNIITRHLELLLETEYISVTEATKITQRLGEELGEKLAILESEKHQLAEEWMTVSESYEAAYTENCANTEDIAKRAIAKMKELEADLQSANSELAELQKPFQFYGGSQIAKVGNLINSYYFERYGLKLDGFTWTETEIGYVLTYGIRRNSWINIDDLKNDNSMEKIHSFTNALPSECPKWEFDRQINTVSLTVILRRKPKTLPNQRDIDKLWETAEKLPKLVKNWSRIRITGGSESGKSPTAENLAVLILQSKSATDARLYNPQENSTKNYWTIPTFGTSHKDSEKGIKELADKVQERSQGSSRDNFILYIFDEIDSTMSHCKGKRSELGANICYVIKQASHQNLGAIFIGQNANVSEYPGMDRSDWNSAVNIHIGSNAYDAIQNSNQFTNDQQTKLTERADKLTEYCQTKNEELGLEFNDPQALRFAFVVEPGKRPYFIELPEFGKNTYDLIQPSVPTLTEEMLAQDTPQEIKPKCPSCGSENLRKNGKRGTKQKYVCKDCEHGFTGN